MADLIPSLAGMSLASAAPSRYHVLHMTYPALHLLPDGVQAHLESPRDHACREKPRLGRYHLSLDNLSFFHRFAIISRHAGDRDTPTDLLKAVVDLETASGQSLLEAVSFISPETSGILHLFRLSIDWADHGNAADDEPTHYSYLLSDEKLAILFLAGAANPWLKLLSDLITRYSDRAFLHVQQQLTSHPTFALRDDSTFAHQWETDPSISGRDALLSCLTCQLADGNTITLGGLDHENLTAHAQQNIEVHLPCGHSETHLYEHLRAMTDNACLHAECQQCGQRVLGHEETRALLNRLERTARDNFCWEEVDLAAHDGPISVTGREIEASVHDICYVLEDILHGFEVPDSVMPPSLALIDVPETQVVLSALKTELRSLGGNLLISPADLFEEMQAQEMRALAEWMREGGAGREMAELPPGLLEFIERWLRRTVNYLAGAERVVAEEEVEELGALFGGVQMSD